MQKRNSSIFAFICLVGLILSFSQCSGKTEKTKIAKSSDYADLVTLFKEFRKFQQPEIKEGAPDYSAAAIEKQYLDLITFQNRLAAIDPSSWPVPKQSDYLLVRAEMSGLEFQHRVLKPWSLDPGFYSDLISRVQWIRELPLKGDALNQFRTRLQALPELVEQAKKNLGNFSQIPGDLATLALLSLGDNKASFNDLAGQAADLQPELISDLEEAQALIDDYIGWIKANQNKMTATAGVGKDNYNWLLKNVYLFPYTWEDCRRIVELEDSRVITFLKLEQNRNRNLPKIKPVQSQAEYKQSVKEAIDHIMNFLRDEEIFTVHDYLVPGSYFGSWHGFDNPWPEKHDYFFNFSHREPVMEETHEMVGHHFDGLRSRRDHRPIRGTRRLYKISTSRGEGFAFGLEELLMHAGYLDGRPQRSREIAYEQAAFRTVRALSDIYMHSGDWSLADATDFCIKNAPHGELLEGSHHLWYELDTTLRGVGHHMLMIVGKVQFMKLFRDRAQQLGDKFILKEFLDEFLASGMIPMSLTRWEMTGYDDEIKRLYD